MLTVLASLILIITPDWDWEKPSVHAFPVMCMCKMCPSAHTRLTLYWP
jgi:hypothetical protein